MDRRSYLKSMAAIAVTGSSASHAQDAWPSRRIMLISTSPAGGNADVIGRTLSPPLSEALKTPCVVENKPGGTGMIASSYVAKAPPDGYTFLIGSSATHVTAPSIYKSIPYDVVRDFEPVIMIGINSLLLAVSARSPYKSVGELIAAAKADPGALSYASPGIGGTSHLSGELLQKIGGVKLIHVPNARNPAYGDVIAGHADMIFEGSVALMQHIQAGLLRPLAVTSTTRWPQLPNVPTMIESGLPDFDVQSWQGLFAPAGTPQPIISRMHQETEKALQLPNVRKRMEHMGFAQAGMGPREFAAFQRSEIMRWDEIIRSAGIRAE